MSLLRTLRKYRTVFAICVAERFAYRTDFFFGTLMRFLPIVTTIFLWSAIFKGSNQDRIAGLTMTGVFAYYLLTMVGRAFSSMPGLADGIARDIRTGAVKKFLTQPVNLFGYLLCSRMAHKLAYYTAALAPFVIVFWVCRGYFDGWPSAPVLFCFLLSLPLAFFIGFMFETIVGLASFWLLEIGSFNFIIITLVYVTSGHMFPLDLAPEPFATILKALPFQYLAYFPAYLFLRGDELTGMELARAMAGELLTAGALTLAAVWIYQRGLRRYSAFGG